MNILYYIYMSFSTRELASITLISLFLLWSLWFQNIRKSIIPTIKSILSPKIFVPIFLLCIIIFVTCYIIYIIDLWDIEFAKIVIIYTIFSIPLLVKTINYSSKQDFNNLIIKRIKYSAFISAYINLYTLNYWMEIIFQFTICLSTLMISVIKRQQKEDKESQKLCGCLNKYNIIWGCVIFIFLLYQTFTHPVLFTMNKLIINVAIPFILTCVLTPYLYILAVYAIYEIWFLRLFISVKEDTTEYKQRKNLLFKTCIFNLDKIKYFEQKINLFTIKNNIEFANIVQQCNVEYKSINQ